MATSAWQATTLDIRIERDVPVPMPDGTVLRADVWRPGDGRPAPALLHRSPYDKSFALVVQGGLDPARAVAAGYAVVVQDVRGRFASAGTWHPFAHERLDGLATVQWLAAQPWCDGRLAIYGGSYGGYLVLCALVEEPGLWRAGVDLYGDSEISESFRHGDRPGRLDLRRQMGSPDDPERAELFRRGSPVYRAERIEAPLLLLHGRKDKRVVPLMTERMVEALEIENKTHEVHWYDDEGHGFESLETKRDSYRRILAFLKRHVMDEADRGDAAGDGG